MIANFSYGVSGLELAQRQIQVTGHNLTNVNTEGYTRQRIEAVETYNTYAGSNRTGVLKKGTGVDVGKLVQIRDIWLDASYRSEASKKTYFEAEFEVLNDLENMLINSNGEGFTKTLDDLYGSISTLSQFPYSLDSRNELIECAQSFIKEAQYISEQLTDMQSVINEQVSQSGKDINRLIKKIYQLNEDISKYELNGDQANDLRDERNLALDELAKEIPITVTEDKESKVKVNSDLRDIIHSNGFQQLTFINSDKADGFVIPVWEEGRDPVIDMDKPFKSEVNFQDGGRLKALMFARGQVNANYTTLEEDIANSTIPQIKKTFDTLVHDVVTMINECLAPASHEGGPFGLDGSQYVELFSRVLHERYDENGNYIEEDPNDLSTLYSIDNLAINSEVMLNFDKICTSRSGDASDNRLIDEILTKWKEPRIVDEKTGTNMCFEDYLVTALSDIATKAGTSKDNYDRQSYLLSAIDGQRKSLSGSSLDEELSNLIKFQHSYGASARVIKTIDSMIENLILQMAV